MNKRLPLLSSLFGVILLAASLAYWILQLVQPPQRPLAAVPHASMPEPAIDAAATLFGGQVATASAANYQLTGIVAAGRDSVAIIVADGAPPKALKVGKELAPGITLAEVHARHVMLSDGGVMKRLELAQDSKPAAPMGGVVVAPAGAVMGAPGQEPPMMPGAVPQPQQQPQQEFSRPGEVGQHDAPANPNANNPPPPAPVQMPPPTRAVGSPVSGPPAETQ